MRGILSNLNYSNRTIAKPPRTTAAILIIIAALALASLSGGLMKILTETMEPALISFFRFSGYLILLFPLVMYQYGRRALKPSHLKYQVIRGFALVLGNTAFIFGVQHVDYANSVAILYVYPFLMISFSVWMLNERISRATWLGVLGGFLGVVLVLRPDFIQMNFNGLFIVFTGLMVALQMLLNRKLGLVTPPIVVAVWGAFVASVISGLTAPFFWSSPGKTEILIILLLSVTTALSQTLMILAMTWASADKIAPFTYFEIPFATFVGFILFGSLPDMLSWIGICLIIASGILVKLLPSHLGFRVSERL